jgi:response regulator RpfG family c-di-GMP phosphodiesterase
MSDRKRKVLVVDDDQRLAEMLRIALRLEGIDVRVACHVIQAEQVLTDWLPDAIVLDVGLPGIDGLFYLERIRESPRTKHIPVVIISGSDEAAMRARLLGANGFLRKPLNPLGLLETLDSLLGLSLRKAAATAPDDRVAPNEDLRRLMEIGRRQQELLEDAYRQMGAALAAALESRDFGTSAHSQRVTAYGSRLTLEFSPPLLDDASLEWGFLLHDVGKIGIPDRILLKQGSLTPEERTIMQRHPVTGAQLLDHVPLLRGAGLGVVRSHHEWWNGTGYPDRLSEHAIPLGARIFAVVDALDAMTDTRPYRTAVSWDEALTEIDGHAQRQFDPDIVEALLLCESDLYRMRDRYPVTETQRPAPAVELPGIASPTHS